MGCNGSKMELENATKEKNKLQADLEKITNELEKERKTSKEEINTLRGRLQEKQTNNGNQKKVNELKEQIQQLKSKEKSLKLEMERKSIESTMSKDKSLKLEMERKSDESTMFRDAEQIEFQKTDAHNVKKKDYLQQVPRRDIQIKTVIIICNEQSLNMATDQLHRIAYPSLRKKFRWNFLDAELSNSQITEIPAGAGFDLFNTNYDQNIIQISFFKPCYVRIQNQNEPSIISKYILQLLGPCAMDDTVLSRPFPDIIRHNEDSLVAFLLINTKTLELPKSLATLTEKSSDFTVDFIKNPPEELISIEKVTESLKPTELKTDEGVILDASLLSSGSAEKPKRLPLQEQEGSQSAVSTKNTEGPHFHKQGDNDFTATTQKLLDLKLHSLDLEYDSKTLAKRLKFKAKAYDELMAWYQEHEHCSLVLSQASISEYRRELLRSVDDMKQNIDNKVQELYAAQVATEHMNDKRPPRYWLGGLLSDEVKEINIDNGYFDNITTKLDNTFSVVDDFKKNSVQTCNSQLEARFANVMHETLKSRIEQQTAMNEEFTKLKRDLENQQDLDKILKDLENKSEEARREALKDKADAIETVKKSLKQTEMERNAATIQLQKTKKELEKHAEGLGDKAYEDLVALDLKTDQPQEDLKQKLKDFIKELNSEVDQQTNAINELESKISAHEEELRQKQLEHENANNHFRKTHKVCLNKAKEMNSPVKQITSAISARKEHLANSTEQYLPQHYKHAIH